MTTELLTNQDAEQAAIGAALLAPRALDVLIDKLAPDDFWRPGHCLIFETMVRMRDTNKGIDALTVAAELERTGMLEQAGGRDYLYTLSEHVPTVSNAASYAQAVADVASMRRIHTAGLTVVETVKEHDGDVNGTIATCEQIMAQAFERRGLDTMTKAVDAAIEFDRELARRRVGESKARVLFHCEPIDTHTLGIERGSLAILAARTGVGKTALSLQIASRVAEANDGAVAFFSLEMSNSELVSRLALQRCKLTKEDLVSGNLSDHQRQSLADMISSLMESNLYLDDASTLTPSDIRARCRRLAMKHTLDLVVVDYIQLMTTAKRVENRQVEVAAISRSLKTLAKELNCPVLALSQLNRGLDNRGEKEPQLSDLRESGAIEQDADLVAFLFDSDHEQVNYDRRRMVLKIAKNRSGRVGRGSLDFVAGHTVFYDVAPQ